jgi:hypothetical protein
MKKIDVSDWNVRIIQNGVLVQDVLYKNGKKNATSSVWHMNCHNSFYNKTTNYYINEKSQNW